MLNNLVLGTSFSPEYSKYIGCSNPLDILEVINNELKIKDIRLGLRWNQIQKDNEISLSKYDRYLEYLFKNDCKVCLNVGPIKVFRWPEEHIPKGISVSNGDIVYKDSEVGKYSYEYLEKLLILLKKEYGSNLDNVMFQLENESFFDFGKLSLTMSNEYMLGLMEILFRYFPKNKVMINSAGRKNLKEIVDLFNLGIYPCSSFVLGFNYYFDIPKVLKNDPLKSFSFGSMSIGRLHRYQRDMGFGLEISEGQFEPWGRRVSPGNSYIDFKFLLERGIKYFPKNYDYKLIRLWGTEELGLKILKKELTEEHERIVKDLVSL